MTTLRKPSKSITEAALWKRIRKKFCVGEWRAYRIEAISTPGFPDVVWASPVGLELIELKVGRLRFQDSQKRLFRELSNIGIPVYVIWQMKARDVPSVFTAAELIDDYLLDPYGTPLDKWIEEYMVYDASKRQPVAG